MALWQSKISRYEKAGRSVIRKKVHPGIWIRLLQNEDEAIQQEWKLPLNGCLDPSHPEALVYIREDVKQVAKWGYSLIKHDFSTYDLFGKWGFEMNPMVTESGWHFYDRSKTSAEVVKQLYQAIYETANEYNAMVLGCNTIGYLGAGWIHINRVGMTQVDIIGNVQDEWELIHWHLGFRSIKFSMKLTQTV